MTKNQLNKITDEDVRTAYLKLKSNAYYDSTELLQRRQLAEFESNLEWNKNDKRFRNYQSVDETSTFEVKLSERFRRIAVALNSLDQNLEFFGYLLDEICLVHLPKSIKHPEQPKNFLTNRRQNESHSIESTTVFIDMPIELHIVCLIWLMKFGHKLDSSLAPNCYGNRLVLNEGKTGIAHGKRLFAPYFFQYQKWRDGAINSAEQIFKAEQDVTIINLDIKDYFHSVRIDFDELKSKLEIDETNSVQSIFQKIHETYSTLFRDHHLTKDQCENRKSDDISLPIGLTTSSVLANWFLSAFDKSVLRTIRPAYYGRYVDDILIVLPDSGPSCDIGLFKSFSFSFKNYKAEIEKLGETISFKREDVSIIEQYILAILFPLVCLVSRSLSVESSDQKQYRSNKTFKLVENPTCTFQTKKTFIYHFDSKESITVLDKLKRDLLERSSEFRDFPDDDELSQSFEQRSYHLIYDDSEGKISTLKDYKENRYGLSVFLAHKINTAVRRNEIADENDREAVLRLFQGVNAIVHFRLWEKLFTYFLVNNDRIRFSSLFIDIIEQINVIKFSESRDNTILENLKATLYKRLLVACEMALSIYPDFFIGKDTFQTIVENQYKCINYYKEIDKRRTFIPSCRDREYFRESNLLRHHFVYQPLINYTKLRDWSNLNLAKKISVNEGEYKIENPRIELLKSDYSPRSVKLWECCIFTVFKRLNLTLPIDNSTPNTPERVTKNILEDDGSEETPFYLYEAYEIYSRLNQFEPNVKFFGNSEVNFEDNDHYSHSLTNIKSDFPKLNVAINSYKIGVRDVFTHNPRLSLANIRLSEADFIASLRGTPRTNKKRFTEFEKLLNAARKEKTDVFVLPECSVPHAWTRSFARFAEQNQILLVMGLEHWQISNISYNFLVTIIPIEVDGVKDAIVLYRLKNHYSHEEDQIVRGNKYAVPQLTVPRYDLINWRGLYFSPYYCAELTDINHRSLFKSKVDLIICSEWNRDVPYFSNIVESLSRDLHVYVAQVNNSEYGDSRITQPKETFKKDIIKIKGGLNSTIIVGEIDINALREFQRQDYALTKSKKEFKPTPHEFNHDEVLGRINNK